MKEQFTDYETAKMLKELGYDEPCFKIQCDGGDRSSSTIFSENITIKKLKEEKYAEAWIVIPLWQQIEEWLWEKHGFEISFGHTKKAVQSHVYIISFGAFSSKVEISEQEFISPITAKIEGIRQAVKKIFTND